MASSYAFIVYGKREDVQLLGSDRRRDKNEYANPAERRRMNVCVLDNNLDSTRFVHIVGKRQR